MHDKVIPKMGTYTDCYKIHRTSLICIAYALWLNKLPFDPFLMLKCEPKHNRMVCKSYSINFNLAPPKMVVFFKPMKLRSTDFEPYSDPSNNQLSSRYWTFLAIATLTSREYRRSPVTFFNDTKTYTMHWPPAFTKSYGSHTQPRICNSKQLEYGFREMESCL